MSFFNGVNPQSVSQAADGFKGFKVGDNYAMISKVEEKLSNSGNPMLEITFANEDGGTIWYYIVDNDFKLSRLKQLYQAFGIPMGETNIQKWVGKWGIVVCKEGEVYNGKKYPRVYYVKPVDNEKPSVANTTLAPIYNQPPSLPETTGNDFVDDIPF